MCHRPARLCQQRHHVSHLLVPCLPLGRPCIGLVCLFCKDPPDPCQRACNSYLHLLQHGVGFRLLDAKIAKHCDPVVQHQPFERQLPQLVMVAANLPAPLQLSVQLCRHALQIRCPTAHQLLHVLLRAPVPDTALLIQGPCQAHDPLRIVRHIHGSHQLLHSCYTAPPLPHHLTVFALCQHMPVGLLCVASKSALPGEQRLLVTPPCSHCHRCQPPKQHLVHHCGCRMVPDL